MASHYHRTRGPKLLGDDTVAQPTTLEKAGNSVSGVLDSPVVKTAITGAGVYHGYKRTGSLVWAIVYGLAARVAPVVTGAVVVAQGFGTKKGS